jgi:hypothetical protein
VKIEARLGRIAPRERGLVRLRICWHGTLVDVVAALSPDPYRVIHRFQAYCLATSRTTGGWWVPAQGRDDELGLSPDLEFAATSHI